MSTLEPTVVQKLGLIQSLIIQSVDIGWHQKLIRVFAQLLFGEMPQIQTCTEFLSYLEL